MKPSERDRIVILTAKIVSAYVQKQSLQSSDVPNLVQRVRAVLASLGNEPIVIRQDEMPVPAVAPRKSVHDQYIICLDDGKIFKSLKRHLMVTYNLTPEDYRAKWGLPDDYPMIAPAYSAQRSEIAKTIGLGKGRRKGKGPQ